MIPELKEVRSLKYQDDLKIRRIEEIIEQFKNSKIEVNINKIYLKTGFNYKTIKRLCPHLIKDTKKEALEKLKLIKETIMQLNLINQKITYTVISQKTGFSVEYIKKLYPELRDILSKKSLAFSLKKS